MSHQLCTEAIRLIEQGAHLIDVRTAQEHSRGAIQGAVNIPLQSLPGAIQTLDKAQSVIVYCASGGRSRMAKTVFRSVWI